MSPKYASFLSLGSKQIFIGSLYLWERRVKPSPLSPNLTKKFFHFTPSFSTQSSFCFCKRKNNQFIRLNHVFLPTSLTYWFLNSKFVRIIKKQKSENPKLKLYCILLLLHYIDGEKKIGPYFSGHGPTPKPPHINYFGAWVNEWAI